MFYYLYEIKNLVNDKIYVGVHKTTNMDDGYMGSGAAICDAMKNEGSDNFRKTILETFETSEEMYRREEEVVNAEFLLRENVYNKRRGGFGGFDYINKNCGNQGVRLNRTISNEQRRQGGITQQKRLKASGKGIYSAEYINPFLTIQHEMMERARISNRASMWITNCTESKKIKKDSLIPEGWRKGRTI